MIKLLNKLNACQEVKDWVTEQAWQQCERGDWMLWLAAHICRREDVVLAACACAETSLHFFEEKYPNDKRPRQAIETART